MPNIEANGITIEYDIRGEGEPILFIMGLAGQLIDYPEDFVDLFVEAGYQAIRFDNRDSGLSWKDSWEAPSERAVLQSMVSRRPLKGVGYTVTDMAHDAAGLLDALGIDSAHVVGVSMGGMIAQELTIEHPEKVKSLCSIMSNTGDRRNGGISKRLARKVARRGERKRSTAVEDSVRMFGWISGPHFDPEVAKDRALAGAERCYTPGGVARQTAAIAGTRKRTRLLEAVTAPTLVIHGLIDPLVKPSGGVATARAIPGSRMLAFADMGHDLPRPRWVEMRDAIVLNAKRAA